MSSESGEKKTTPTQATFNKAERERLGSKLSKIRQALLKILEDDKAEEEEHSRIIKKEALARERRDEERRSSQSETLEPEQAEEIVVEPEVVDVTSASGGLRRTTSFSRSLNQMGRPRSRSISRPPPVNTQIPYFEEDQVRTARPTISTSQVADAPFTLPSRQERTELRYPDFKTLDGQIVMTPYMTIKNLTEVYDNLPKKLRDLLNPNKEVHWPYIQEWYRNQVDENLDEEMMKLCTEALLGRETTLSTWNDVVKRDRK